MMNDSIRKARPKRKKSIAPRLMWEPAGFKKGASTTALQMRRASGITGDGVLAHLSSETGAYLQFKKESGDTGLSHSIAAKGLEGTPQQLPYFDMIQRSFGRHDVSNVQTFQGSRARLAASTLSARAYAMGNSVVLGEGGSNLHTVAHEAAHIVQQRGGVSLKGGVGERGDQYEQHADKVADAVVQGKSSEGLLDQMAGSGVASVQRKALQLEEIPTTQGIFRDELYEPIVQDGTSVGMSAKFSFEPGDTVNATKIAMVQAVKSEDQGEAVNIGRSDEGRRVPEGEEGAGYELDRAHGNTNPVYGADAPASGNVADTEMSSAPEGEETSVGYGPDDNSTYQLGYRKREGENWVTQNAELADKPKLPGRGANSTQVFETTAVAVEGEQTGTYYGSIKWGWETNAEGVFSPIPVAIVSMGNPSANFTNAAEVWNGYTFVPAIERPDETGNTRLNEPLEATNGDAFMTLAAGSRMKIAPDAATVGSKILVTLDTTARFENGSNYWIFWIDPAAVTDGRVTENTECEKAGKTFTVNAGSQVELSGDPIGGKRLAILGEGVLSNLDVTHRIVWLPVIDVRGGETTDLPLPS